MRIPAVPSLPRWLPASEYPSDDHDREKRCDSVVTAPRRCASHAHRGHRLWPARADDAGDGPAGGDGLSGPSHQWHPGSPRRGAGRRRRDTGHRPGDHRRDAGRDARLQARRQGRHRAGQHRPGRGGPARRPGHQRRRLLGGRGVNACHRAAAGLRPAAAAVPGPGPGRPVGLGRRRDHPPAPGPDARPGRIRPDRPGDRGQGARPRAPGAGLRPVQARGGHRGGRGGARRLGHPAGRVGLSVPARPAHAGVCPPDRRLRR